MGYSLQNDRNPVHKSPLSHEKLRQRVRDKVILIVYGPFLTIERIIRPLVEAGAEVVLLCQTEVPTAVARLKTELDENGRWQVLSGDLRQPDFLMQVRHEVGTPDIFLDLRSPAISPAPPPKTDKFKLMFTFLQEGESTGYTNPNK